MQASKLVSLLRVTACAALLAATPAPAAAQPVKSDQDVLVELEKSWNEAFYSKDLKFIESILADEFISTYEDGSRADKKKELALTAAFDQKVVEAVQDDFTVKVFGNTAVVWFTLHLVGIKQGQTLRADPELHRRVGAPRRKLAVRLSPQHARHFQVAAGNPSLARRFRNNSCGPPCACQFLSS